MTRIHLALMFVFFLLANTAFAQHNKITVTIVGLHSDKGKLYLSLYNSAKGYPNESSSAYKLLSGSILNHKCTIVIDDIPNGTYAVACYHDENDNRKLDKNLLGIPVEGIGASNNAKSSMGPPKFSDAQFTVDHNVSQTINISY